MKYTFFPCLLLMVGLSLSACVSSPVDDAFDGDMGYVKETRTIVDYCQTCHVHRNLDPIRHLSEATLLYTTEPYSSADDCKTCHSIKRDFWNDLIRSTRFPDGRVVGG